LDPDATWSEHDLVTRFLAMRNATDEMICYADKVMIPVPALVDHLAVHRWQIVGRLAG
jgi:hypothetical protein